MLFALFINDKLIDDYKTLAQAIFAASEEELMEIDWCIVEGCLRAPSPSVDGLVYRIRKNSLESIQGVLGLPSNVNCIGCEFFEDVTASEEDTAYTDCNIDNLKDCPIIRDKIS